jgi:hypothetical protein
MADSTVSIKISNLPKIKAAFAQSPNLMRIAMPKAINQSLLTIGAQADRNLKDKIYSMPPAKSGYKRTGNLLASILDPNRGLKLATPTSFKGSVGSGVGYGLFVEQGTRFMPARSYLEPAVNTTHEAVQKFFTDAVQSVLNTIGKAV